MPTMLSKKYSFLFVTTLRIPILTSSFSALVSYGIIIIEKLHLG